MRKFCITQPDNRLRERIEEKIENLNKPKGSLGRLESLALQICLVQQTLSPVLRKPCHLLLGSDHGIEREGVSVSPRDVTWQQMVNFSHGGGGVNMFCRQHGFKLIIVDMGVDYDLSNMPGIVNKKMAPGTRNFRFEPAMSENELNKTIETGAELATDCYHEGCNILCLGEMGIGNTSPSSVWMHLLGNFPLDDCIGAGAGLSAEGVEHKKKVLQEAVDRFLKCHPPAHESSDTHIHNIISYFGGFEMVAAIGAMLQAAEQKMLIMVDGFIMSACALAASRLYPHVLDYMIFGHCGNEKGHRLMLNQMKAEPLLSLGLHLGEGTGALCSYPIIDSAVRMMNEMNNFENAKITKYF